MQKPVLFPVRCLLALLVLISGATGAQRDERGKPQLPKPPPQPVEYNLKVKRGERLTVPLKIYGSQREALKFLIRKEPAAGKLSKIQTVDRETARVTYDPPADLEVTADRFSYAVQNSAGVSAAVDVNIAIVDDPPVLGIPDTVEFPPVLAGKTAVQEVEVSNRGGGMAEGELEVESPFQIEGEPGYRLGAGESATFKLVYAPTAGGSSRGELKFSSDRTRTVALRGTALAPISAEPANIELMVAPGTPVRVASFDLVNGTAEAQTVKFSPSPRFILPESVEIPPNGRAPVTIQTSPAEVMGIAEDLVMEGAGVKVRVPVRGKPMGPVLKLNTPELNFGASTAPQSVEVQNVGGAEGYWKWEPLNPFVFSEEGFRLPHGSKKQLNVGIDGVPQGALSAVLRLTGEQQILEIPVSGSFAPPPAGNKKAAHPNAKRSASSGAKSSTSRPHASFASVARGDEARRGVEPTSLGRVNPTITELKPNRATVTWPLTGSGTYRLQERLLKKPKGQALTIEWRDFTAVQWSKDDKQITAKFDRLEPGRGYTFRIVDAAEPAGSLTIGHFQIVTPLKKPLVIFTPLRGLILLLAILGGLIFWQRRKAQ